MNNLRQKFSLSDNSGSVSLSMLPFMQTGVVLMIAWSNHWCVTRGIKPVWTSWIRTNESNERLGGTRVHPEGRGADLSVKPIWGWTEVLIDEFLVEFEEEFYDIGALVYRDDELISRPILRHDSGHGDHLHMQVRPQ